MSGDELLLRIVSVNYEIPYVSGKHAPGCAKLTEIGVRTCQIGECAEQTTFLNLPIFGFSEHSGEYRVSSVSEGGVCMAERVYAVLRPTSTTAITEISRQRRMSKSFRKFRKKVFSENSSCPGDRGRL